MTNKKYPQLEQFFGCYFHQDWTEEFKSPEGALDAFVISEKPQSIRAVLNELDEIINANHSDDQLIFILRSLGSCYAPKVDGKSVSEWIKEIRNRFSQV